MKPYLEKLVQRTDLTAKEAQEAITYSVSGTATEAEIAAFLALLAAKGETAAEVTGVANAMRAQMVAVHAPCDVLDIVGTGGDGFSTVNISTAAAILAAAAGCKIAKHGNRSVSSKSGSADVLEALSINISMTPEAISRCINKVGIAFMFAPKHHPAMKHVAPVRKAMKIRTVFNIIGPLLNPCGAKYAVIGVYKPELLHVMADVLIASGVEKAVVVHSAGLDEYSNTGVAQVVEIDGRAKRETSFNPVVELGLPEVDVSMLKGGDANHNASIIREVLSGNRTGPIADAIALNAAVCCYVFGLDTTIQNGFQRVRKELLSGRAIETLEKWAQQSQDP